LDPAIIFFEALDAAFAGIRSSLAGRNSARGSRMYGLRTDVAQF